MDPRLFGNFADQYVRTFRQELAPRGRVYRKQPRRFPGSR